MKWRLFDSASHSLENKPPAFSCRPYGFLGKSMTQADKMMERLGNEPPIVADGRKGPPDRREVSARWLTGTFLTGFTSIILMGVALSAALDGRQQLATPAEIMAADEMNAAGMPGLARQAAQSMLDAQAADAQAQALKLHEEMDRLLKLY